MNSRKWQLAVVGVAVGALVRCSSSNGPSLAPCTAQVTLTATSGLQPRFTWTPNCLVDEVTLEENIAPSAGGPQPRWAIRSRMTGQGTRSPLLYGVVPATMEEVLSPATLVAGHEYSARVYGGTTLVGVLVFRP